MIGAVYLTKRMGVSYRQLDYWIRQGYLSAVDSLPGSGHFREFTATEARVAILMARHVRAGMTPGKAVMLAREEVRKAVRRHGWHIAGGRRVA